MRSQEEAAVRTRDTGEIAPSRAARPASEGAAAQDAPPAVTARQLLEKNHELYDDTSGPIWETVVYRELHGGWDFINLGGRALLDRMAGRAGLGPEKAAAELCCGRAATCRYLAQRFGCRMTGVELNAGQLAQARSGLAQLPDQVARRIHLVQSDILGWRPDRAYDAAISIDSLMLIADLEGFFKVAYDCLGPGGHLLVAVILGGPEIDERYRRFLWEADGMVSLPQPEGYRQLLKERGFERIDLRDMTSTAVDSSAKMLEALGAHEQDIIKTCGQSGYDGWAQAGRIYLQAFEKGKLGYWLLHARRPR
ncbi:MAG TPA: methyltransferase domain-containing protein [Acidobacteriota bacterium]|nr:methyltransferase domain-containing protein [Acidobacteriota bacterium]